MTHKALFSSPMIKKEFKHVEKKNNNIPAENTPVLTIRIVSGDVVEEFKEHFSSLGIRELHGGQFCGYPNRGFIRSQLILLTTNNKIYQNKINRDKSPPPVN